MTDRSLSAIVFCGDRSRLGRAVLLAAFDGAQPVKAVVLPSSARWTRFEARLSGQDSPPIQQSVRSRLDPLRHLIARFWPKRPVRDALDIAWGLPDPPEIPTICRDRGAEVIVADDVNDPSLIARLAAMRPDVCLVGAYPQIFREPLLCAAGRCVNVHPSLLPRFRGANPVYWTLATGAQRAGVTAHLMAPRVDAGPILAQTAVAVTDEDEYYTLYGKLVRRVPDVVAAAMVAVAQGEGGSPQIESEATTFREPRASDRRLDWGRGDMRDLWNRVRAGGAFAFVSGEPVEVRAARMEGGPPQAELGLAAGTITDLAPDGPGVALSGGRLYLTGVVFRGLPLDGPAFASAAGLRAGVRLT